MGKLNFIKGRYTGKMGSTSGAKWKDKNVIRTFSKPTDPDTEKQRLVRTGFGDLAKFTSYFADELKYLTALDTKSMTLRNMLIKINKENIKTGTFDPETFLVSKGGLQRPQVSNPTVSQGKITATFTPPTATNFTSTALLVALFVDPENQIANVKTVGYKAGTVESDPLYTEAGDVYCYFYFFDKKKTSKTASLSVEKTVTIA